MKLPILLSVLLVTSSSLSYAATAKNNSRASKNSKSRPAQVSTAQSQKLFKKAPAFLQGLNPFVGYGYQGVSLKKRNNSLKETHTNLQTTDYKGVYLGVGMEHKIASLPEINMASRLSYYYGKDTQSATVSGNAGSVDVDTNTSQHVFRLAEAIQFNLDSSVGVLRPTFELGVGFARVHDELNASGKIFSGNIEANGTNYLFDVGAGLDFKFNNGLTPFAMAYYRFLTVDKKDMKVASSGKLAGAQSEFDYQLSGLGVNVGLGYTF